MERTKNMSGVTLSTKHIRNEHLFDVRTDVNGVLVDLFWHCPCDQPYFPFGPFALSVQQSNKRQFYFLRRISLRIRFIIWSYQCSNIICSCSRSGVFMCVHFLRDMTKNMLDFIHLCFLQTKIFTINLTSLLWFGSSWKTYQCQNFS